MLKKRIKYTDYNGTSREEDFYFNLTQAEIMEMEMSSEGRLTDRISHIVDTQDAHAIITVFKEIILKSYGEKSADGRRFVKSKELSDAFAQTEAYSVLFMELASDSDAAAAFVNGVIPAEMARAAAQQQNALPTAE